MSSITRHGKKKIRIEGSRRSALDMARGRLVLISAIFSLAYIVIAARVVDLSLIQGELANYRVAEAGAVQAPASVAKKNTRRADIVDRNGVLLATSLETASLFADPKLILDPAGTSEALAKMFPDLTYGDLLRKLQGSGRFTWIKRNLTPHEQEEILALGEPGLAFKNEYKRIYPQGDMAPHIVGFTNVDGKGLGGVERSFNEYLTGGHDAPLRLTIDTRVQHILNRALSDAVSTYSGLGGAGVVMDVRNGEILAAASMPDFDPHAPRNQDVLFNRLTLGVYEMGSTFKIFSTAAVLEYENLPMAHEFDARESIQRGRFKISDYHAEDRKLSIPEVFMVSSNIGSALMGEMVGTERLRNFYRDLGLLDPVALEIGEIGRPLIPIPWRDINTLTASYGHGIAVSPLQMVAATGSIVNGGILLKPTVILDQSAAEKSQNSTALRIISPQTAHRMRQLLRLAVTDGTGKNADVEGYRVGGKTGTAEKSVNGKYDRSKRLSSFVGFFPMDAPRYAVFIMVDEPKGTKESFGYATGGWVAAPAVGRVVEAMGPLLGVKPAHIPKEHDLAAPLRRYVRDKEGKHLVSY
jgi:cell division protein FtsI (penicillin-binding protein 3)